MWSPHGPGIGGGGGGMKQLMVQVDGGSSRLCGVEGEGLVEVWRGGKVLVGLWSVPLWGKGRSPLLEGRAPLGKGALLLLVGGLVIPSFSFMQLRVDDN